jgi:ABC-2 type transport system ATP-binding protein
MADPAILAEDLHKEFASTVAVAKLDLRVESGEIFGLLGPNGAGKTTTLRMIVDLFRPDRGTLRVLGTSPQAARPRVGYLPEERGLYRDLRVHECLVYFGRMRGLTGPAARRRASDLLDRLGLAHRARDRIRELSRGMQQKAQIAATLMHEPELVIFDEPFQGLDPVNVDLVRTLVHDLQREGRTVVVCAHEMSLVETLCERVALIFRGRVVLEGRVAELRRRYSPLAFDLSPAVDVSAWPEVASVEPRSGGIRVTLDPGATSADLVRHLARTGVAVDTLERVNLPLESIFVQVVGGGRP